jgi:hypothetical protein
MKASATDTSQAAPATESGLGGPLPGLPRPSIPATLSPFEP